MVFGWDQNPSFSLYIGCRQLHCSKPLQCEPLKFYCRDEAEADKEFVLVMMSLSTMVLIGPTLIGVVQLVFLVVLRHSVLMSYYQALAWTFFEVMGWPA